MAEEHLRQLIYTYASKGKIEPWEYQEIQSVAQRHNISPARMQTLITEVVNSIDFQNLPKETPKPGNIMAPFLHEAKSEAKANNTFLKPFQKDSPGKNEPQWVRSEKKKQPVQTEQPAEPAAKKENNTFKVILLIILILLSLYVLMSWIQPDNAGRSGKYLVKTDDVINPVELEKYYNGLYYSTHKKSKTLLVLQISNVDEDRGRADVQFTLNGESYREKASLDFENHNIRIPKLGTATFYKINNTVIIESNDSVNPWKIK